MENNITNITFGIRYTRSFRIPDISGEMVDDILRGKGSPFDDKYFPQVGTDGGNSKILRSEEHDDFIAISRDDIVFGLDVENFESDFERIRDKILPYFVDNIIHKYKISRITRLGIIFRHKFENNEFSNRISKELSSNKISDPNEMIVRFSKKLPTMEGGAVRGKDNYKNAIYKFESVEDGLLVDFDYQYYFLPPMGDIRETKPKEFMESAKKYLKSKVYDWLSEYESS